jgi:hypothetical protein
MNASVQGVVEWDDLSWAKPVDLQNFPAHAAAVALDGTRFRLATAELVRRRGQPVVLDLRVSLLRSVERIPRRSPWQDPHVLVKQVRAPGPSAE